MPKPSDFFLSLVDFFSVLLPGSALAYLIYQLPSYAFPFGPLALSGSAEGWIIFLFSAYVLGHFLGALGGFVLDPLYDQWYAPYKRLRPTVAEKPRGFFDRGRALFRRILKAWTTKPEDIPEDPLLRAARTLKRKDLSEIAAEAGVKAEQISNTFWWAGSVVRLGSTPAGQEVSRLQADSKFFRSTILVLVCAFPWIYIHIAAESPESVLSRLFLPFAGLLGATFLAFWRFFYLRWAASERTYEYFVALHVYPEKHGLAT